ncbi:hypothetical protein Q0Z83_019970 [Actinoplanes sichuanensis]|uniref:DUF3592 domain-containing protein n=1 Tax=Actinoplanes sichuanensis TaxID=512349 RepID=A0ABW4AKB6_9ACTN|nr:hypothetical protein [Actinoplanes sichuanensis]BEL03806.1 hypothetical protein Q0Z83_019970 [Actinoplanes sichuanensis]
MRRGVGFGEFVLNAMLTVLVGTILVCGGLLLYHGADPMAAYFTGTPGHFTASTCEWLDDVPGADGYECRGVFTGEGLRLEDVRLDERFGHEPEPVTAVVSGPDADTAHPPGLGLLGRFGSGILMTGIGLWAMRGFLRAAQD